MTSEKTWHATFRQLFTSDSAEQRQHALSLRDQNRPSTLIKFRDLTDESRARNWDALQNDYVWLPSIDSLNDPFDCGACLEWRDIVKDYFKDVITRLLKGERMPPSVYFIATEAAADPRNIDPDLVDRMVKHTVDNVDRMPTAIKELVLREALDRFSPSMRQSSRSVLQYVQSAMNVVSFSENCGSPAMWAHYSNNHTGYCSEYTVKDMSCELQNRLFPVFYDDARYQISVAPESAEMRERMGTLAALHKSTNWAYEEEWRLVIPEGKYTSRQLPMPKPRTIYIGVKMLEMDKLAFEHLARKRGIALREVEMGDALYTMALSRFIYRP